MIRKSIPQQGKNALVRQDGFPWRFDPSGRRCEESLAELVVKHPFPGIEFEHKLDRAKFGVDEAAAIVPPDLRDIDQGSGEAGLYSGVFEIGQRAGVLVVFGGAGQMQQASAAELSPRLNQALMNRIELVSMGGDDAALDALLEPGPLKQRRLENRSRRVRIILQ